MRRVTFRHQPSGAPALHDLRETADGGGDNRGAARVRFQRGEPERFRVRADNRHVSGSVVDGQPVVELDALEADMLTKPELADQVLKVT